MALGLVSAHRLHHHHHHNNLVQQRGIDEEDLMAGAHWRKPWPEGIDDSTDDHKILHLPEEIPPHLREQPREKFEWKLDEDIIDSQRHLKSTEENLGTDFGEKGYQDRGYHILNSAGANFIKSKYL